MTSINTTSNQILPLNVILYNLLVVAAIVLLVITVRYITGRLLRALIVRGVISPRGREIIIRLIDLVGFFAVISTTILLFSPQSWIVLVLIGIFALIVFIAMFDIIKPYIAGLAIQMSPIFRAKSLDIAIPGYNNIIGGKLVKTDTQYLVIQDVFGNEYYVRNDIVLHSIIRITPIYVRLTVEITYKEISKDFASKVNEIIQALGSLKTPLFKEDIKVSLLEASSKRVIIGLKLHPMSCPVRQSDLLRVVNDIIDTVKNISGKDLVLEDVIVKVSTGLGF